MSRATWGSRLGFVFAAAGSAIGLANIWRFPYVVGSNGGSAFIVLYLVCLLFIGFPVFLAEILIGRTTQTTPGEAFEKLGKSRAWGAAGRLTILTGFIVSAFYSAVAAWVLGYFVEALLGNVSNFKDAAGPAGHFAHLQQSWLWCSSFHFLFLLFCTSVLYLGVRNGIEKGNKIMMPLLFVILLVLTFKGLWMPNSEKAIKFLLKPDWSALQPTAVLIALGQSFFTLSIGQGTMITYGSYLGMGDNLLKSCISVVLMDTCISLIASIAIFTIAFSVQISPDSGPGLIFHTLPVVFSQIPGGYFAALLFFLLVFLAALTSEISAMEPAIAYLMDEKGWKRHTAVAAVGVGAFVAGLPCALSYSLLKNVSIFGEPLLDAIAAFASNFLIPFGGFLAVVLVGWRWGVSNALKALKKGISEKFDTQIWVRGYFWLCFKWTAPILIIVVFMHALGFFG